MSDPLTSFLGRPEPDGAPLLLNFSLPGAEELARGRREYALWDAKLTISLIEGKPGPERDEIIKSRDHAHDYCRRVAKRYMRRLPPAR